MNYLGAGSHPSRIISGGLLCIAQRRRLGVRCSPIEPKRALANFDVVTPETEDILSACVSKPKSNCVQWSEIPCAPGESVENKCKHPGEHLRFLGTDGVFV